MKSRKGFLTVLAGATALSLLAVPAGASGNFFDFLKGREQPEVVYKPAPAKARKHASIKKHGKRVQVASVATTQDVVPAYKGAEIVNYVTPEVPGTLIIRTQERALYRILGDGKAMRYLVAVGKEGFSWAGTARVGAKAVNPRWTPPPEMIRRTPKYAKWKHGMPGGVAYNPLGPRAMYLYTDKGDTGFRIHGTIHPESIGHAASSGCIRMLNAEVIELFGDTKVGTKVIVI
ncbi:L,D-transpeptidase [Aestuariivirga litoralis]|uniref:L,D-transpeptidase n=1 Tax=Aestuariivirga litoralis TaxID=2650924 RepID=UPI0018C5727C|nr:L,D-transpeptidase [Aestuariivirga litoralis]MBG1230805.1 L,D-transpeptidase [Aestuariivirga litoralis]